MSLHDSFHQNQRRTGFVNKAILGLGAGAALGFWERKNLPKMAPLPKRRRTPITPPRTPRRNTPKRRKVVGHTIRVKSNNGTNVVVGASKRRGRKVGKEGRKKPIKVGSKFRKKVKQALETSKGVGWMRETLVPQIMALSDNIQTLLTPGRLVDGKAGFFFTPNYVNYVASVLYGKHTESLSDILTNDPGLFRIANLKIDVIEQNYVMRLRNNSPRTLDIHLHDYSPKSSQSTVNPVATWGSELSNTSPFGAAGTAGQESRENVSAAVLSTLGNRPQYTTLMRHLYTWDTTTVKLEPGKEYYHKVRGPNHKTYAYNRYFKDSAFQNEQKFSKGTIITCSIDLVATTLASIGRYTDIGTAEPLGLIVETEIFTKIRVPERAGFQVPSPALAAGDVQNLTQKNFHTYALKYWPSLIGQAGVVEMRVDENPVVDVTE